MHFNPALDLVMPPVMDLVQCSLTVWLIAVKDPLSLFPAHYQIQKKITLIFGVKKFHAYLFGRSFSDYTDHNPLSALLDSGKPISSHALARIQKWNLYSPLMYQCTLKFRASKENANADALS